MGWTLLLINEKRGVLLVAKRRDVRVENGSVALRHEIIRQRIARRRGEGKQKDQIEKDRRNVTVESFVEGADGVINVEGRPTDEELHDQHDQQFQRFATLTIHARVGRGAAPVALPKRRRRQKAKST